MSFPLQPQQLPYCHGKWDEKTKKFIDSNPTEVASCCLDSCKDYIDYCYTMCGDTEVDTEVCQEKCNELWQNCISICTNIEGNPTYEKEFKKPMLVKRKHPSESYTEQYLFFVCFIFLLMFGLYAIFAN